MTPDVNALRWEVISDAGEKQNWQCKKSKLISVQNNKRLS